MQQGRAEQGCQGGRQMACDMQQVGGGGGAGAGAAAVTLSSENHLPAQARTQSATWAGTLVRGEGGGQITMCREWFAEGAVGLHTGYTRSQGPSCSRPPSHPPLIHTNPCCSCVAVKFLLDRSGRPVRRYAWDFPPTLEADVQRLLAEPASQESEL